MNLKPVNRFGWGARHLVAAVALVSLGCITIKIYFPAAQLKKAAEEIVNEARPDVVAPEDASPEGSTRPTKAAPRSEGQTREARSEERSWLHELVSPRFAYALAEEKVKDGEEAEQGEKTEGAKAEGNKDIQINISSPVIKKIRETLKKRYPKLLPYYQKGAIGEGRDGYLALRDTAGLGLKEKRDVQAYTDDENKDRKNLYIEIARENGIDESHVADIAALFSVEWQKKCKPGWWVEKDKGKWEKKPAEKEKKGKP